MRARFGDLRAVITVWVQDDLIYLRPSKTKTSGRDKSRLFLEMLGPLHLFGSSNWFLRHMEARAEAGIPFPEWEALPVFNGRYFCNLPAKSDDFNKAIQQICEELGFKKAVQVTGHSAKASMITFAGSRGMTPTSQSILAYHVLPNESKATRVYDRGRLLEPVKALQFAIEEYVEEQGGGKQLAVQDAEEKQDILSSDSGSSSDEEDESAAARKVADNRLIINENTGKIHQGRFDEPGRTACGVLMRNHYRSVTQKEVSSMARETFSYCNRGCFDKEAEVQSEADESCSNGAEEKSDEEKTEEAEEVPPEAVGAPRIGAEEELEEGSSSAEGHDAGIILSADIGAAQSKGD